MAYKEAGEFSNTARVEYYKASATIAKGDICVITPAAISTAAKSGAADASANYPVAVATQALAENGIGAFVVWGEVSVTADGNCYKGAIVAANTGKAKLAAGGASGLVGAIGKVTEGGADTTIVTIFLGQVI